VALSPYFSTTSVIATFLFYQTGSSFGSASYNLNHMDCGISLPEQDSLGYVPKLRWTH
jgi:hypothetical protein